jgi:hypothetical protein
MAELRDQIREWLLRDAASFFARRQRRIAAIYVAEYQWLVRDSTPGFGDFLQAWLIDGEGTRPTAIKPDAVPADCHGFVVRTFFVPRFSFCIDVQDEQVVSGRLFGPRSGYGVLLGAQVAGDGLVAVVSQRGLWKN